MNKRLLEGGILGFLLGRGNVHPFQGAAVLLLLVLGLLAIVAGLVVTYPLAAVAILVVVAMVYRHRAKYHHVPQQPSHHARPPSQDALDAAYAEGFNRGQREARKVEHSWPSVPAYDETDENSF
ncbi:MAG: hypothetical protein M0005_10390 [Actinomycetota bacterium]|jgi:hypothetical protein|nr:hypothetical protein [Actinomycetota bacterium]